ncbi:MAG TPA: hypothetical protein VGJ60_22875 [Chloroflexota bacterium]
MGTPTTYRQRAWTRALLPRPPVRQSRERDLTTYRQRAWSREYWPRRRLDVQPREDLTYRLPDLNQTAEAASVWRGS